MGGDQGGAQGPGGVPPQGDLTYHGDDGETRGRRRVLVTLSSGGNRYRGATPHQGVHQEAIFNHIGKGGLKPHL